MGEPVLNETEFPYYARIMGHTLSVCGGAILNDHWVLTAAQCFQDEIYSVAVGMYLWEHELKTYPLAKMILHEDFDGRDNNIAMVKTQQRMEFNERVQPIHISNSYVHEDQEVITCGFQSYGGSHEIKDVRLQILKYKTLSYGGCRGVMKPDVQPKIHESSLCALTAQEHGLCVGDDGGPLILNGQLVGIASYYVNECGYGYPDVFTRVSSYMGWIKMQME